MAESRLNIELFQKIREKIATTPTAYDQSVFARAESLAPCGTAACVAGWACVLSGEMTTDELKRREQANPQTYWTIEATAKDALGLYEDETETLFTEAPGGIHRDWHEDNETEDGWPWPYWKQWREADSHHARAAVAVAYLDHIIETGKVLE